MARIGLEMGRPAESDPSDVASAGTDLLRGWREARDAFGGALAEARARSGCSWWSCLLTCGFVARMALWPLATVQRKAWKRPTKGWKDVGKRYCHVAVHVPVLGLASSAVRNLARLEPSMVQGGALWFQDLTQNTLGSAWDMPMGAWGTLMPLCAAAAYKASTVPWKHAQGTAAPAHGSDMRALLADWTALGVFLASCIAPHATVCYWMGNHAAAIVQTNVFTHKDAEEMKMEALKSIVLGAKTATEGNVKHAEALFERATKLDSNQVHAWIAKASLAHQRGDNVEAERCLRTAVTINPRVHAAFLEPFLREQRDSTNREGGRESELNEEVAQTIEKEGHEPQDEGTQASGNDQTQTKHRS